MRAEIVRLVFSLCLVGGAFFAGLYVGWRRWGLRREQDHSGVRFTTGDDEPMEPSTAEARRDLFAPATETIDLRFEPSALPRRTAVRSERPTQPERSLPRAGLVADEIVTYRRVDDPRRAE